MNYRCGFYSALRLCLIFIVIAYFANAALAQTNYPPILPKQSDRIVQALTQLIVTNTAADPDVPPEVLNYGFFAPDGAKIDANGIITWTPTQAQAGTTNLFTTFVFDSGTPQMMATNSFVVFVVGSPPPPAMRTLTGLLGWWPGDGDAGDLLGANNGVMINGAGFSAGHLGQAFQFHGTNDYLEIPDSPGLNPRGVTIEAWIYPEDLPNGEAILVNKGTPGESWRLELGLFTNSDGALLLKASADARTNAWFSSMVLTSTSSVPMKQWTHVALTLDYQTLLSLYVNGNLENSTNGDFGFDLAFRVNPEPWLVGGGLGDSFTGRIDELTLYSRALSADEIQRIYSVSRAGDALPPQIVTPPRGLTTGLGSKVVFTVAAASPGGEPLQYQWQFNGTDLTDETNSTLTLQSVQPPDSGPYAVRVANAAGSTLSDAATLAVAGIVAWGEGNWDGELDVPAGLMNVSAISAGGEHTLALKADGTVAGWGLNERGQVNIPAGLSGVIAVAGGSDFSLALKGDGTLVGWGGYQSPAQSIPADLTNITAIAASWGLGLALRADSTLAAWDGSGTELVLPASWTNLVAAAGGGSHFLGLKSDGTVLAWGDNSHGQSDVPAGLTNVVAIAANLFHSVALRSDGTVVAWGATDANSFLVQVPSDLTNVVAIAAGEVVNLALKADGTVVEWGGAGSWGWHTNYSPKLPNVFAISAGMVHAVALLRDGAPHVTVQPWDLSVPSGGKPKFAAKAVGLHHLSYQWQFNGNAIGGATQDSFSITNAQPSDAGIYSLAVSNEVGFIATRQAKLLVMAQTVISSNHAPVLPNQTSWALNESSTLFVVNTATDPDHSTNALLYQLINPPDGATIDTNGVIRWVPTEAQGPGTYTITTVVTKAEFPELAATNSFKVFVSELNHSPALAVQPDRALPALTELIVSNMATDPDRPFNVLSYHLVNAPTGAAIDSYGIIHWTPNRAQGPSTNEFITIVTDDGVPPLSATNQFRVIVTAPSLVAVPDFVICPGQVLSFTNVAMDNDSSRHLRFTLEAGPKGAAVDSISGVFTWRAPVERAGTSNYVRVRVTDDNSIPLSDSREFRISVEPLTPAIIEPIMFKEGVFKMRVTGGIGPDYILQGSISNGPLNWNDLQTNTPTSMPAELEDTRATAFTNRYYRVRLGP